MKPMEGAYVWRTSHRTAPWRTPAEAASLAKRLGMDRVIIKTREGTATLNPNRSEFADALRGAGLDVWIWSWPLPRKGLRDTGGRDYITRQAEAMASDSQQLGAKGIVYNMESPWSWSTVTTHAAGHRLNWGNAAQRRAELELRTRLLLEDTRRNAPGIAVAVCTFPRLFNHALPFDVMAQHATHVESMAYSGNLTQTATLARQQWLLRGATMAGIAGPCTKRRGAEGVRAARTAVRASEWIHWWSLDQASASALEELGRRASSKEKAAN